MKNALLAAACVLLVSVQGPAFACPADALAQVANAHGLSAPWMASPKAECPVPAPAAARGAEARDKKAPLLANADTALRAAASPRRR